MSDILVAKIGGSTLGSHDTALEDVAELQRRGLRPVVVHGGGALISEWLSRHNVPTHFERGLRVTDEQTLEVVVAVLAGLVNKQLVASLLARGARVCGVSGADGGMLRCRIADEKLGFVGDIVEVDATPIESLLADGVIPVVAPIGVQWEGGPTGQLLNVNADTSAGAIAAALRARWLVFLTDVAGVRADSGATLSRLEREDAERMIGSGVIEGGMIPKVEACLRAGANGTASVIVDGREEHKLLQVLKDQAAGTLVG